MIIVQDIHIMKTVLKFCLTLILTCIVSVSSLAQTPDLSMSTSENNELKTRVAERVALMNSYIKYMADKKNKKQTREYYAEKALALFIGKGYSYTLDSIKHDGVMMQTTSTNTNKVTSSLIRIYFQHLIGLKYTDIKVTSTSVANMKVSDIKKISANKYVCTCQYVQYFYGYRDGCLIYRDRTTKRIECLLEAEVTDGGPEYIVQLGDVEALHTERF
jgi:hypothetical protein